MKIALFSGRFDPPHIGHLITILRLLQRYDKVIVIILEYPERKFSSLESQKIIDEIITLSNINIGRPIRRLDNRVITEINYTHFGKITEREFSFLVNNLRFDFKDITYVGGNEEVNEHIKSLDIIPVEYIPRSYFYSSTDIKNGVY